MAKHAVLVPLFSSLLVLIICVDSSAEPKIVDDGIECSAEKCHLTGTKWMAWNVSSCADPRYELEEVESNKMGRMMTAGEQIHGKNLTVILLYLPYCHFSAKMGATLAAVAVCATITRVTIYCLIESILNRREHFQALCF
jgi:hypothetical protein